MSACDHTERAEKWVTEDYFGEPCEGYWEYSTRHTTEDVGLHSYRCTKCKEVMYYSSAAKDFYTKGIRRGIFS